MNIAILILALLNTLSDIIELTYDLGVATRKYILPAVIFIGVGVYHYSLMAWDRCTSQEWTVKIRNTPLTSGLAFG